MLQTILVRFSRIASLLTLVRGSSADSADSADVVIQLRNVQIDDKQRLCDFLKSFVAILLHESQENDQYKCYQTQYFACTL